MGFLRKNVLLTLMGGSHSGLAPGTAILPFSAELNGTLEKIRNSSFSHLIKERACLKTELTAIPKEKCCCFSGHRPDKLPGGYADISGLGRNARLHHALTKQIRQAADEGFAYFLCGMALGVDTWAAQAVLSLKKQGYPLYLIAACPCKGQESKWRSADKDVYRTLLAQTDAVYTACETYTPYCMNMRNRWMVDHAARLIAVFDGISGGTASTVEMAQKKGLEIIRLNPSDY